MRYRTKDKSILNVRLSHFLYNGLDVMSAKLGMTKSEVVRMALYNLFKDNFNSQEMDKIASDDQFVDEWIAFLQAPGRAGPILMGGDKDWLEEQFKKGELERYDETDEYEKMFDEELEKRLKPIRKKYAVVPAEEFLRETEMTEQEASEYFKNYFKTRQKETHGYMKEIDKYFKNKYPKERKEIEDKLEVLLRIRDPEARRQIRMPAVKYEDLMEKKKKNVKKKSK